MAFSRQKDGEKQADDVFTDSPGLYTEASEFHEGAVADNADNLQRHLNNRQIQLIAIGGSIGTALFITIGDGLAEGGPGSLFLAYTIYSCMLALVNNCIAEMTTAFPVSGGFIRLAGKWVDDALGFMVGWNFFFYEALLIPFEITALNLVISFWSTTVTEPGPTAAICAAVIVCYAAINILAVKAYGEAEFWLSGGKVVLIFLLLSFTFVTMVGGNPQGDAYGFRYWNNPGAFLAYLAPGSKGRFEGFLAALWNASFTVVGPEYISMVAAEAKRPRIYIKAAFKTLYFRFGLFFIGGSLAVGIVCSARNPTLVKIASGGSAREGAGASPYVIAMQQMGIKVLPDIVNALMMTSVVSAGNTYVYCAVRNLYGLALEGRAPEFLTYTTRKGVPIYCFGVVMLFPCLSFLQCSNGSSVVLRWLINLITAGGIIDYIVMTITYIFFYRACKAQGLERNNLPYRGYFQPYCAWLALVWLTIVVFCYGYTSFSPWSVMDFFLYYAMLIVAPILFIGWKLIKRTHFISPLDADLVWDRPTIDAYEASFVDPPIGFWRELGQLIGIGRHEGGDEKRFSTNIFG